MSARKGSLNSNDGTNNRMPILVLLSTFAATKTTKVRE